MHRPATSNTKIELPFSSTPPNSERMSVEHVAHQHLAQIDMVFDTLAKGAPAGQHMRDRGIGIGGPVGFVGVVHGHHIGDESACADKAGEIGHHVQAAVAADQETGMGDVVDPHRCPGTGSGRLAVADILKPGRGLRQAMQWLGVRVLRGGGAGSTASGRGKTKSMAAPLAERKIAKI